MQTNKEPMTNGRSKVSIITVCFNAENTIENTIQSVVCQNYTNKEYVIIDGGSTDGTQEIIKKYIDKIDIFISEPDNGIFDAMNKGINLATGDWINFINSGDSYINPKVLSNIFSNNSFLDKKIIFGDTNCQGNEHKDFIFKGHPKIEKNIKYGILRISHQASFIRHEAFLETGFYDQGSQISADCIWFNNIYMKYGRSVFQYIPILVCNFDTSGMSNSRSLKVFKDELFILQKITKNKPYYNSVLLLVIALLKYIGVNKLYRKIRN